MKSDDNEIGLKDKAIAFFWFYGIFAVMIYGLVIGMLWLYRAIF